MSENKQDTEVKTVENGTEPKKKNKNFLVLYSVALFIFAAVLITLSYLSQARQAADTDKIRQEIAALSEKTEISTGFQNRLEQVSAKNDDLEKANETLSKENEELKKKLEALQGADLRAHATEYLWKIEKAYGTRDFAACKKLIGEMIEKNLREALSMDALTELVKIEAAVK